MRRFLVRAGVVAALVVLYLASPFVAAWSLREAVHRGDVETIARKVEWAGVRDSLKRSLGAEPALAAEAAQVQGVAKPTLWQRIKTAFGATMVDRFVETYVTPEGLPRLYQYGRMMGTSPGQKSADGEPSGDWRTRFAKVYARVKRAEFLRPDRVEITIADQNEPTRHYVSALELIGFEWKLVSLRVITVPLAALPLLRPR